MKTFGTKDALGTEIVIGNYYGYSVDNNGITTTSVGKAENISHTGKLTLGVLFSRRSLWMGESKDHEHKATKVSVKAAKVFPISDQIISDYLNKELQSVVDQQSDNENSDIIKESFLNNEIGMFMDDRKNSPFENTNEELTIYYEGQPISILSAALVEGQNLSKNQIEFLKDLHAKMHVVKNKMKETDDRNELHKFAVDIEKLEYEMQEAWGFDRDRNFHTHWLRAPKCICPYYDNKDYYGTNYRNINLNCPVHGKI